MKILALAAAAILACAIIPMQAFSDDNYNWMPPGLKHNFWFGYSNSTFSFGYSNKTMSFGYSNSTHDDDDEKDGDDSHHKGPNCMPLLEGHGLHLGEKKCLGIDPKNSTKPTSGHATNPPGKNSTHYNETITPEKNKQNLYEIVKQISHAPHANTSQGQGPNIHKNSKRH